MKTQSILFKVLCLVAVLSLALAGCGGGKAKAAVPPFIRVVSGTVETGTSGSLAAATDNTQIAEGATVKTGADSRAVLFFNDGSQITVEPNTEAALTEGEGISVALNSGAIWAASNVDTITVDAGGPVASGAKTGFYVVRDGSTVTVSAVGSSAKLAAGGSEVEIPAGQESKSEGGAAPSAPAALEVKNSIRISLEGEALVYLADPAGRAVGYHPNKEITLSQIPNGWYVGKAGRPQVITVPNLLPGEYTILLVAANNQTAWKIHVGVAGADGVYTEKETSSSITWGTPTGITLTIRMDANNNPSLEWTPIWTLYTDPPGRAALSDELKRTTILFGATVPGWASQQ